MLHQGPGANIATTIAKNVVSRISGVRCPLEAQPQKLGPTAGLRGRLGIILYDRAEMTEHLGTLGQTLIEQTVLKSCPALVACASAIVFACTREVR